MQGSQTVRRAADNHAFTDPEKQQSHYTDRHISCLVQHVVNVAQVWNDSIVREVA